MEETIDYPDTINQIHNRLMRKVYEFNLMLVGTTGVGKSTLVKSLFKDMIKPEETVGEAKLNEYAELLEENGVEMKLRCIETSNFDSHRSDIYTKYIDDRLKSYFVDQRRMAAWKIEDTRVHCCLYMIQPYGKLKLRDEDIQCMRALHERVNLVPIIAKADTFNTSQLAKFKENILAELKLNGINYYKFSFSAREDEERAEIVRQEAERFPFAVVAADEPTLLDGEYQWIRETISGHIDIYNKSYDFGALAQLLCRHCILDLIDSTHSRHYARIKAELLEQVRLGRKKELEALGLTPCEIAFIDFQLKLAKGKQLRSEMQRRQAKMGKNNGCVVAQSA
jgi:septin family protein